MRRELLKTLSLLFAVVLVLSMAACTANDTPAKETGNVAEKTAAVTTETTVEETEAPPVTLTIFACALSGKLGIQTDPVAKYIEDSIGVILDVYKDGEVSTTGEMLGTMLASNDLADVMYMKETQYVEAAVKANSIIALDDLIKDAPFLSTNEDVKACMEYDREHLVKDGKLYTISLWNGTGLDEVPVAGPFIRWDLYKQLGYPEIKNNDDLVQALSDMLALHPETPDGQKVYGLGGFFGENADWGNWVVSNTFSYSRGYGELSALCKVDIVKNEIAPNQLTDENSIYWETVDFYYKANQAGLLDPDSPTLKFDKYVEKLRAGKYLLFVPGWESEAAKNALAENGEPEAAFVCLPSERATILAWTGFLGGMPYAISSACKNPEAAMKLLDFVSTPEASRTIYSGVEGMAWEMKDGKPALTAQYLSDRNTMDASAFEEKYGLKYSRLQYYALNCINPFDGEYQDLTKAPSYRAQTYNDAEKDAIAHYGVDSINDIYLANGNIAIINEYLNMPEMPAEMKAEEANIAAYLWANIYKCIYAKDDANYAAQKQVFIEDLSKFNVDGVYQWYVDNYNSNKAELEPQIKPLLESFLESVYN